MRWLAGSAVIFTLLVSAAAADGPPSAPFVTKGEPVEAAQFGTWRTFEELVIYPLCGEERNGVGLLRPGERFRAIGSNIVTTQVGKVEVTKPIDDLKPGDVIHLLALFGEATFSGWYKGEIRDFEVFWSRQPGFDCCGKLVTPLHIEWWVRVEASGGRKGWIVIHNSNDEGFIPREKVEGFER